jgi:hypothetical protein
MKSDPLFNSLHEDPRFEQLLSQAQEKATASQSH